MSRISEILIAPSPASPMLRCEQVRAVAGRGLEGDRYFLGVGTFSPTPHRPDFEITLIEQEFVDAFAARTGLPFTASSARRNLVTTGVRLNDLVEVEFQAGGVRLLGMRLCEPCSYLARITFPEVLPGLVHQGGLRARILSDGWIRVGDPVTGTGE